MSIACLYGGRSAFNKFISKRKIYTFLFPISVSDGKVRISGVSLNIIFDPPHLIKGIRNNLLSKDMVFKGKVAKWSDIVEVYKNDCKVGDIRMLHKLTDEHVIPEKIKKMKVKNCTQALSERTAAMLSFSSTYGKCYTKIVYFVTITCSKYLLYS